MAEAQTQLADFVRQEAAPRGAPAPTEFRLIGLTLKSFKGIESFGLRADGGNLDVYGDNATGKTTLFDAFTWLLFDRDSANRKDFDIKTLGPDGEPAHGLEHEVEGVFTVGGKTLTLRKAYSEQWTKRRGGATKVFTGHTTEHHIDGVPVRKQDYDARVAAIADEKVFRLLADPAYFNEQLTWQERRAILLAVCGDLADSEVIASEPKLADLATILGDRKVEAHRKVLAASRTKINKDIEQIPIRISEVQRGLPEAVDATATTARLIEARGARHKKQEELALAESGGEAGQQKRRLAEVEAAVLNIETAARRAREDVLREKRLVLEAAHVPGARAECELADKRSVLERIRERVTQIEGSLEALREKYRRISAEEFAHTDETVCPACGQALPEEMVEEARRKALERFNVDRAERLERLNLEGKTLRANRDEIESREAERYRLDCEKLEASLPALRQRHAELLADLEAALIAPLDLSGNPDYAELTQERDSLTAAISAGGEGQPETGGFRLELAALDTEIGACEQALSREQQRLQGETRIRDLKAEEKRLAAEFERLEHELYLTEEFVRAKVRLLTDRINSRFSLARFKLFEVQVNGAVSECCETTVGGVPYGSALNRGARLNVGLDIINTLSEHYGFAAPIWVDNAEAVTRLIPVEAQLIRLVVSEPDQALRVEKEAS